MKEYIVAADLHWWAPHAMDDCEVTPDMILLGDIVDRKNCEKKWLAAATKQMNDMSAHFGDRYVWGNHECMPITSHYFYKDEGVIFLHSDTLCWGDEKANKARARKPGASKFKRGLISASDIFRNMSQKDSLSDEQVVRCVDFAKAHGCSTIVCGHRHPKNVIDFIKDCIRVVILPRGISVVKL